MKKTAQLADIKETRRRRLGELLDKHGKLRLAELTGISGDYLYQMSRATGPSARNVSDKTAERIETALRLDAGWLNGESAQGQSQPQILDTGKLHAAMTFLENLFLAKNLDFVASENATMIAAIYQELLTSPKANLVELSVRYGSQIDGSNDERQGTAASTGSDDQPASRSRAKTA
jgi:hypothetical protein